MITQPRLHCLLGRARRGIVLPAEGEQLAELVGELEAFLLGRPESSRLAHFTA